MDENNATFPQSTPDGSKQKALTKRITATQKMHRRLNGRWYFTVFFQQFYFAATIKYATKSDRYAEKTLYTTTTKQKFVIYLQYMPNAQLRFLHFFGLI